MPDFRGWSGDYPHVFGGDDPVPDRRQPGQASQSPSTKLRQIPAVVVLERMPVPVLAIDQDGFILFANAAFAAMIGCTSDSILGLKFHQIFGNLLIGAPAATTMRAYGDQLVELAHHDGSTVRASMSKSAMLRYDDGVALVAFHDLTEKLWSDGSSGMCRSLVGHSRWRPTYSDNGTRAGGRRASAEFG